MQNNLLRKSFSTKFFVTVISLLISISIINFNKSSAEAAVTFNELLVPDYGLSILPGDGYQQEEPYTAIDGPDGNLWYLLYTYNGAVKAWLVKYDAETGVNTRYQLLTGNGGQNTYLLKGSDGNLWYTGQGSYLVKIEINSSGVPVFTSVASPGGAQKSAITVGPNGNFWYQSAIGWFYEVDTNFQLQRQCWTNTTNTSGKMAFDNSGNLWFGNKQSNTIGKLNVNNPQSCDYVQYSDPNISSPKSVILGPDNNLWFISTGNTRIGKITPSGVITTYTSPSLPRDLVLGPDNQIWLMHGSGVSTINTTTGTSTLRSTGIGMTSLGFPYNTINLGCRDDIYFTYKKNPKLPSYIKDTYAIGRIDLGLYTPPTTSITNTSDSVAGTGTIISFDVASYDETLVSKLELYVNNILVSSVSNPSPNHTFTLDTSSYSEGTYSVTTKVYDEPDNCPVISDEVEITIDNESPVSSIENPQSDILTNQNSIPVTIKSTDNIQVEKTEVYIDSILNKTITNPSSIEDTFLNTQNLTDGNHIISIKTTDTAGNSSVYSYPYNLIIDKTKPVVAIVSPANSSTISGITTLSATSSDTNGIKNVQFKLNGSLYGNVDTSVPYSISWDTTKFADGNYTLSAIATDNAGNTKESSTISFTVKNTVTGNRNVELCHFPDSNGGENIIVSESGAAEHLSHGDYLGRCLPPFIVNTNNQNTFSLLNNLEEFEEIDVVRQLDNSVQATINEGIDLGVVNIELQDEETLIVNGLLGSVNVKSGATIKGNGKVKSLAVDEGAYLAPGSSPGCLTSDGLILEGTYTFELGGKVPCIEHDQVIVNGVVTLKGYLDIVLDSNFTPEVGQSFIVISNDGNDSIVNTFKDTPEGTTVTIDGIGYEITYSGGDGNDVELSVRSVAKSENNDQYTNSENSSNNYTPIIIIFILLSVIAIPLFLIYRPNK